ncbi:MAG TPA: hypothetical protein VFZ89_12075, partial [Solirubrobacteraceae bacterium]
MSGLSARARLAAAAVAVLLVLGGAIYVIFLRGGDDEPTVEAGSRFSDTGGGASGAPLEPSELRAASARTGSDPAPPSEDEIKRSPGAAAAGLFLVGFRGTLRDTPFLKRLAAIPY